MNNTQLARDDTFTAKNLIDAYCSAYYSVHGRQPARIVHIGGKWFRIDEDMRDRAWVLQSIEQMRNTALETMENQGEVQAANAKRGRLMRLIKGLSKFARGTESTQQVNVSETIVKRSDVKSAVTEPPRKTEQTVNFQFGATDTLILQLGNESLAIPSPKSMILGRDPDLQGQRGVDLSYYDAEGLGVSRKHAQIYHNANANCLEIVDLGSSNGTYINGQALNPLSAYQLYDGDLLNLGMLEIRVKFTQTRV